MYKRFRFWLLQAVLCTTVMCSAQANNSPKSPAEQAPSATATGDSTKLVPIKIVRAAYPEIAQQNKISGEVIVKAVVGEAGDIIETELVSGDATLAPAALEAVKQWKFEPFIKSGKPVRVVTKLPFEFEFLENLDAKGNAISVPATSNSPASRFHFASSVKDTTLLHKVYPAYPPLAMAARISGTVFLAATITKEGGVQNLHLISGHPMLVNAALDAVRQWRYRPFLLKGEPVEVLTTITVNFQMHP